jgi:hypothetical protein
MSLLPNKFIDLTKVYMVNCPIRSAILNHICMVNCPIPKFKVSMNKFLHMCSINFVYLSNPPFHDVYIFCYKFESNMWKLVSKVILTFFFFPLSARYLQMSRSMQYFFFFFLIKNVRPEKLIIAILPGRNYSSTYPLRAAHEGPR